MSSSRTARVILAVLAMIAALLVPTTAQAATNPAAQSAPKPKVCTANGGIRSVTANATKIVVHGSAGTNCAGTVTIHLLGPWQWQANPDLTAAPVAATVTANKAGNFTAQFARMKGSTDLLYYRFAAADSTGKAIGLPHYVDDWQFAPENTTARQQPATPKGLGMQMTSDAEMLGVQHSGISISLNELMQAGPSADPTKDITFQHDGKTFYFKKAGIENLDRRVKPMSDNGMLVYLILVLLWDDDPNGIFAIAGHPDAPPEKPDMFSVYAFNTVTEEGTSVFAAAMEFLAERYSRPDAKYGHIMDYILGNEIQSAGIWQKMGDKTLPDFIANYTPMLRIGWNAVRKYNKDIRVYTSLDHNWTVTAAPDQPLQYYKGKDTLDELNKQIRAEGNFPWQVAQHPYPDNMFDADVWNDPVTDDFNTTKITLKNLQVLPEYLQQPQFLYAGEQRHVVLSEQGCQDKDDSIEQQKLQAACWAYAYYKTVMAGIDGFIWVFQVDNRAAAGLRMGLWTWDDRERPDQDIAPGEKKLIYDVFRDIDTAKSLEVTKFALDVIGVKSWEEAIPGFDPSKLPVRKEDFQVPAQVGGALTGATMVQDFSAGVSTWQPADHANAVEPIADGSAGAGLRVHFDDDQVIAPVGSDNKTWRGVVGNLTTPVDATTTPIVAVDVRLPDSVKTMFDADNQLQAQIRAYSTDGTSRFGIATIDPNKGWQQVQLNLGDWAGRASINRIKVWAKGSNGQEWLGSFDIDSVQVAQSVAWTGPNLELRAQASTPTGGTLTVTVTNNGAEFYGPLAVTTCDGVTLDTTSLAVPNLATGASTKITAEVTAFKPVDPSYPAICLTVNGQQVRLVIEPNQPKLSLYDFETDTQGWQAGENVDSVSKQSNMLNGPFGPHGGSGMLDGLLSDGPAELTRTVFVAPDQPLDLSAASQLTAWADAYGGIPGATYSASLTVESGTDSRTSTKDDFKPDQWNLLAVDIGDWAGRSSITKITVTYQIHGSWPGWTGAHMQVDDVGYTLAYAPEVAPCRTGTAGPGGTWLATAGAALGGLWGGDSLANTTYRQALTTSAGGDQVRVRFANPYTDQPLTIDCASVGIRQDVSATTTAIPLPLTQGGKSTITVPPGGVAYSDAVALPVQTGDQLLISTYVSKSLPLQSHPSAQKTTYAAPSGSGNHTGARSSRGFAAVGTNTFWVDGLDVTGNVTASSAIAIIGDSISDSAGTAVNEDTRWTDVLANRLAAQPDGSRRSVVNAAIGGNALSGYSHELGGKNTLARLDRDAISRAGVSDVVIASGTNDILLGSTADQVIYGMTKAAQQIHDAGQRAIVMYIIQRKGGMYWTDAMEAERKKVNDWIATQTVFDAALDFRPTLADPVDPDAIDKNLSDDATHPNKAGAAAMGAAVDLAVFSSPIRPVAQRISVLYDFDSDVQGWTAGANVSGVSSSYDFPNAPKYPVAGDGVLRAAMTGAAGSDRAVGVTGVATDVTDPTQVYAWVNGMGGATDGTAWPLAATITVSSGSQQITQKVSIPSDRWTKVAVDVSGWQFRNQITGITITYHGYQGTEAEFQVDDVGVIGA